MEPAEAAGGQTLKMAILDALAGLDDRENAVIRMRFGIDDSHPCTLEQIGQKFGLSRERIRQIEAKVLGKLRHPRCCDELRGYLYGA